MEELKKKLKAEIEQADWDMLRVHHENGAVFMVASNLSLEDVGVALAMDKTNFVKIWLDNGELTRPSEEEVAVFEKDKFKKICDFIIVQPYVLVKLIDNSTDN